MLCYCCRGTMWYPFLQLSIFVEFASCNQIVQIATPPVNNHTENNLPKTPTYPGVTDSNMASASYSSDYQPYSGLISEAAKYQEVKKIKEIGRRRLLRKESVKMLPTTSNYPDINYPNRSNGLDVNISQSSRDTIFPKHKYNQNKYSANESNTSIQITTMLNTGNVNKQEEDIDKIYLDGLQTKQNMVNATVRSQKDTQRRSKDRRFLSSVQASLKEHIKEGKEMWKKSKKELAKIFDKYYECLTERIEELKREEFPIKALLAVEGEKVQMTCRVCYRPDQSEESQKAVWQVLHHETTAVEDLKPDKRMTISKDHTLLIEDIDVEDAGQYFCVEKRDYAAVYQLDVFLTDKRRNVRFAEEPLTPDIYLVSRNLHIFTMWSSWGECNTCDRPGHKMRVGQCTAKKIYQDMPLFPRDYPLMALYPEGVPCHSTALPRHMRTLSEIGSRESETQITPCMETCPTDPPITIITDETGKVVDVLEPGFYSMKGKPPAKPSLVKRKVLFEPEKSHLVLNCPTNANPNVLHWTRREREVDPNDIKKQTKGRVWVDSLSRLHLKPLLLSDTDVYNCWNKNEKVAAIKVIVVNEGNQNIKHYISYAGLAATIIGAIICIFCICCKKSDKNAQ